MNRTDEHVDPDARCQAATLEFLTRPDVHGVPAGDIVTIRTHMRNARWNVSPHPSLHTWKGMGPDTSRYCVRGGR